MKKAFTTFVLAIFVIVSASAQTQSGYVKTKGRMDSNGILIPGTHIGGVAITLAGGHSTVADANGNFKITVPNKKFFLRDVQKQGYVLTDPDILSKQYVCSANPLAISMETPQQQMRDQIEAQKKIEATLREQLAQREKDLEALKKAHKLTEEDYYRQLQQLYDEKATQELVKEMSKRYSEIDYDLIDSFQRQFSSYILNGELAKADSLLKTKGNLTGDIKELHRLETANAVERAELERRRARLDTSIAYAQWLMEDIAMRCENKTEIFKLRYMNDSAAYYLELRAGLDTTNVEWQLAAGVYIMSYTTKFDRAMSILQEALKQSQIKYGEIRPLTSFSYLNIGSLLLSLGDFDESLTSIRKACDMMTSLYKGDSASILDMANTYNSLGLVYSKKGEFENALAAYEQSLNVIKTVDGNEDLPIYGVTCSNIALLYQSEGKYDKALDYLQLACLLFEKIYPKEHPII